MPPIGSIPRPPELIAAVVRKGVDDPSLGPLYEAAIRDTVLRFEATGSPVITDGEQRKYHNFWTYPVEGLTNTRAQGPGRLHGRPPVDEGRLPAIALTALARSEDRTRALHAGFLAHVAKPVESAEIIATVASVVGRTGQPVE